MNKFVSKFAPTRTVQKANLSGDMGSLGNATNKLFRQFKFPDSYAEADTMLAADHDRMLQWDHKYISDTIKEHTGTGDCGLGDWAARHSDKAVMALLCDLFKVRENHADVEWTGFRITGTVHRGNGYPVFSLYLFAKHPNSSTKVYSGPNAANCNMSQGDSFSFGFQR